MNAQKQRQDVCLKPIAGQLRLTSSILLLEFYMLWVYLVQMKLIFILCGQTNDVKISAL